MNKLDRWMVTYAHHLTAAIVVVAVIGEIVFGQWFEVLATLPVAALLLFVPRVLNQAFRQGWTGAARLIDDILEQSSTLSYDARMRLFFETQRRMPTYTEYTRLTEERIAEIIRREEGR